MEECMRRSLAIFFVLTAIISFVWADNSDQTIKRVQWSREITAKLTPAEKAEVKSVTRQNAPIQLGQKEVRQIQKSNALRTKSALKDSKSVDLFKTESFSKSITPVNSFMELDTLLIWPNGAPNTISYVAGDVIVLAIFTGTDTAVVNFLVDNGDSVYTPGTELTMVNDEELIDIKLWDGIEFDGSPAGDGMFIATLNTNQLGDGPGPIMAVQNAIVFLDVVWMNSLASNHGMAYVGAPDENTSISGMVITKDGIGMRAPAPNVVVVAEMTYTTDGQQAGFLTKTDVNGNFLIEIPDAYRGRYKVFAIDVWQFYPGLLPEPSNYEFDVWGDIPGVNFTLVAGSELIYGYVKNETGTGIPDVPVFTENGPLSLKTTSGTDGYFEFHVSPGWWYVNIEEDFLEGQYMFSQGQHLEVFQGGDHPADFTLYALNAFFSGHASRVDGTPVADLKVFTDIWVGERGYFNNTVTDANGDYVLGVSTALQGLVIHNDTSYTDTTAYWLSAWYDDKAIISPWNYGPLFAPHTGLDFKIIIPDASLSGTVYNASDNSVLFNAGIHAFFNAGNGSLDYWAYSDSSGHYEIPLVGGMPPAGNNWILEVYWPWEWMVSFFDSIGVISGNNYTRDFYINPPVTKGFINGYVYNNSGVGISNAKVEVYGPQYYEVHTDGNGYFSINDVPFGYYGLTAYADGYDPYNIYDVWVGKEPVYLEFWMGSIVGDITINGHIRDAETTAPIPFALLMAFNWNFYEPFTLFMDSTGYYEIKVKSGYYDFQVGANGFWAQFLNGVNIMVDTTIDFALQSAAASITDILQGNVVDDSGNLLRKVLVYLESENYIGYTYTDFNGHYTIGLPTGYYEAMYSKTNFNSEWRYFDFPTNHPGDPVMLYSTNYVFGPQILSVLDVPMDQGKQVRLTWKRAESLYGAVKEYQIWRAVERFKGPEPNPEAQYEWDYVTTVPVNPQMDHYNVVVSTLYDKVGEDIYWTGYLICAIGWDGWSFWNSNLLAGWSEDNLAPAIPKNLTGSVNPRDITLKWEEVTSEPVKYYTVYRKVGESELTLLGYSAKPEYVDNTASLAGNYKYCVSATDYGLNESEKTQPISLTLTGIVGERAIPTEFGLSQNFPNPFNPVTSIEIALPHTSGATLTIYNLMGQVIREFKSVNLPGGYHTFVWDACNQAGTRVGSGIYIYTLTAGDFKQTRKMILMR